MQDGRAALFFQQWLQVRAGAALFAGGKLFGRAGCDDGSALVAAAGAKVDDVVGGLDHIQVVLNDDQRVARVGQAM